MANEDIDKEYRDNFYRNFINSVKNETYFVDDQINHKKYFITERQLLKERYFKDGGEQ